MNNYAFGTIAGLQKAHYGTPLGTVFSKDGDESGPPAELRGDRAAYGVRGVRIRKAAEFKPALERGDQVRQAVRDRRRDAQRAGADGRPLEHHGHLLPGQEGPPRLDRLTHGFIGLMAH